MTASEFRLLLTDNQIGAMDLARRLEVAPHDILKFMTCHADVRVPTLVEYAVLWIINLEKTETFMSGN